LHGPAHGLLKLMPRSKILSKKYVGTGLRAMDRIGCHTSG